MPSRLKDWFKEWFVGHIAWSIFKMDRWLELLMAGVMSIATVAWARIKGLSAPEQFVIALLVFAVALLIINEIRRFLGKNDVKAAADANLMAHEPISRLQLVSRLSWKWKGRSTVKIAERAREETTKALQRRREGRHFEAALAGTGAGFQAL
jgi:hypothetical protein